MKESRTARIAIVGAGVMGRMLALRLSEAGEDAVAKSQVTLFEQESEFSLRAPSFAAAGMLAPYCEAAQADEMIFRLGLESLDLWPKVLQGLVPSVYFQRTGSLAVAHTYDLPDLNFLKTSIATRLGAIGEELGKEPGQVLAQGMQPVDRIDIARIEPSIDAKYQRGVYFPLEGQVDTRGFMTAALIELRTRGVDCRFNTPFDFNAPGVRDASESYDWIVDCRGIQAKSDLPTLRAVRGEVIRLEAREVQLTRPIRVIHPRYPLYIVPRPNHEFIIGATQIEVEDESPISVRSTLELLSTAYALDSAFSEARVLETQVGLRPAFPDHLPRIQYNNQRILRINGLYRHGYLISPKVAEIAADWILHSKQSDLLPIEQVQ